MPLGSIQFSRGFTRRRVSPRGRTPQPTSITRDVRGLAN